MDISNFIHHNRERAFLVGDYSAYRTQLSRQLLKTRKNLGRTTKKNQKEPSTKIPISADDIGSSHEFARLQLLTAERAWTFAMAMKAAHGEGEQTVSGATRSHVLSRLCKAAKTAERLSTILKDEQSAAKATERDILEARAYACVLYGSLEFEKHVSKPPSDDSSVQKSTWQSCLSHFSTAHVIYTALLHATKLDVFKEMLGNVDPSIRYAAYQARYPRTLSPNQVAKQHFPRADVQLIKAVESFHPAALASEQAQAKVEAPDGELRDIPTTVTWRGRKAPIADASIGQALANTSLVIDKFRETTDKASSEAIGPHILKIIAAAYDDVLGAAQDTVDNVRRAIAELNREGVAESDSRMQDLRVTDLAVNYDLIAWRVGRNRVLISSATSESSSEGKWQRDDGLRFSPTKLSRKSKKKQAEHLDGKNNGPRTPSAPSEEEPVPKQLARLTARVKLFDLTLQSIDSAASLRGAARDPAFQNELAAKRVYFSTLRSLNIAISHRVLGREREALAVLDLANRRANAINVDHLATAITSPLDGLKLGVFPSQLTALQEHLNEATRKQHGLVALQEIIPPLSAQRNTLVNTAQSSAPKVAKPQTHQEPLIYHLDRYPEDGKVDLTNLVNYPPKVEPVPVKPIFLDLAWNYIDYPGRRQEEGAEEPEKPAEEQNKKKRGWFGFGR
ncbi:MAG: hypothetical protein Q9159_003717 [Coniocarpon cinnabarinum]